MYCCRVCVSLLLMLPALPAAGDYLVGGGAEADSAEALRFSALGSVGLSRDTWLSAAAARSTVELPTRRDSETTLASVDIDHHFDPVGLRAGLGYWGDPDVLESADWNVAVYYRNERLMLAAEYDARDFDFTIPETRFFPGRTVSFDASGVGLSARLKLSAATDVAFGGTRYDYSVRFQANRDRDLFDLLSATRLSLINSLVDDKAWLTFGVDRGLRRFEIDLATSRGAIDQARSRSVTLRYLFPVGDRADLELGLGYDDADLYDGVTFFSVFLYFYGD